MQNDGSGQDPIDQDLKKKENKKVKCWRLLAQYNAETLTYSACAGQPASPYTPDFNGQLIGLRTITSREAASSLQNHVQFKLTSTTFRPNSIECGAQGTGLQTVPAVQPPPIDWSVDQPVLAGVPITIEARNEAVASPVTVSTFLYGLFQVG